MVECLRVLSMVIDVTGLESDSADHFAWRAMLRGEGPTSVTVSGRVDYNLRCIAMDERLRAALVEHAP
jgi:hypothetical protein